jgi:hypothetical protein
LDRLAGVDLELLETAHPGKAELGVRGMGQQEGGAEHVER